MITLENVQLSLKRQQVIKGISVQINDGEACGIVGPNGAGKSTFLKLVASVLKPNKGNLLWNGIPYEDCIKKFRQQIGYIPQEIALFEDLTVKDQINFWKRATKKKGSNEYIENMVQTLGLYSVLNKKVKALSGGWKRKLNLCAGLLHNPEIILLDEPTVGVDLAAKDDILRWLKTLHQNGKTIILISHEWDVIQYICEKVYIVKDGQLLFNDFIENLDSFVKHLNSDVDMELMKILRHRSLTFGKG